MFVFVNRMCGSYLVLNRRDLNANLRNGIGPVVWPASPISRPYRTEVYRRDGQKTIAGNM